MRQARSRKFLKKGVCTKPLMRSEDVEELARAVGVAKKVTIVANLLYKPKLLQRTDSEKLDSAALEILLKLGEAKRGAAISSLASGDPRQALAALREMEKNGLVKILETSMRTYAVLTPQGWKLLNDILSAIK